MPNYCYYTMAVSGYHCNVDAFTALMNNDYDKPHMYRIFEATVYDTVEYGVWKKAYVYGDIAWSIACCMLPGYMSYFSQDFTSHFRDFMDHKDTKFLGTNLLIEAARLNLTIDIYSTEPGMAFCEDIKVLPNGTIARNKCGRYESWWIDNYETYQELVDDYCHGDASRVPFTESEFNELKDEDIQEWVNAEFEWQDTIPNKPKYLAKLRMYHLLKDGEEYDKNRRLRSSIKSIPLAYNAYEYLGKLY